MKTIKGRITRHFTHTQSYRYIDVLPEIVKAYNDTYHSTIKMAPSAVNGENELSLWRMLYPPMDEKSTRKRKTVKNMQSSESKKAYTFSIGDHVRLSHLKKTFDREYDQKWTGEIFKISRRMRREGLNVYRVVDYHDEPVEGTFYEVELQSVEVSPDKLWKVAKIIKSRKRRGQAREVLVRWLHWPQRFDTWVEASEVENYQ